MRILRCFAILLIITGFVGFLGAFVCTLLGDRIPRSLELPLGDVGAIATDSSGRIYCSSKGYSRIQEYGEDGRFLLGWAFPYKSPDLTVDQEDRLHVVGWDEETIYDHSGRILGRNAVSHNAGRRSGVYRKSSGWAYTARTPNLWPSIVRASPAGKTTAVVTTPFYLWMFAGPLPGCLRAALGILILNMIAWRRRQREEEESK